MCIKLETLNDPELCEIFEAAEEANVYDSLFSRCREELRDTTGDDVDLNNAAIDLSREKWETMNKTQKINFLRDVHFDWLRNRFFE